MPLTWTINDRANRVWFWFFILLAAVGGSLILWGEPAIWTMLLTAMLFLQAWRLAMERTVTVTIDDDGITKQLGRETWLRAWSDLDSAEVRRVWGTDQVILLGADSQPAEWNYSNKLFGLTRLGRGNLAAQIAPAKSDAVRALLADRGWAGSTDR